MAVVAGREIKKQKAQQINWAPVASARPTPFPGNSYVNVYQAMVLIFGNFPIRLSTNHIGILNGMAAAAGDGGECYRVWSRALENFKELELTDVE